MSVAADGPTAAIGGEVAARNPTQPEQLGDAAALARLLNTTRREIAAALQEKSDLLRICSLLAIKAASLQIALEKANELAYFDELTGLPNRRLLTDRFNQAAALADRHRQQLALVFFDVNEFKLVNDEFGHDAGDEMLRQMSERLSGSMRKSDSLCRYGGDEFVGLLTELAHHKAAERALHKIRTELAPPYVIGRHRVPLTVSAGLAIYPRDGRRFTDLVALADRLMFRDKADFRRQSRGAAASNLRLRSADQEPDAAR